MFSTPRRENSLQKELVNRRFNDRCDLIEVVNELQNKLAASGNILKVSLPQIVVVGCQSAGKSSVLEGIIGKEFLPRGTGIVTRRPTVIQLQPSEEEYAMFLHLKTKKFTSFEAVKQEIIDETLRDPGPTGFSSKPITIKIYARNVLKLTFVDMPGIIKNAVGNQSQEVKEEINNMNMKYIEQPSSLILAVSPANQDIANSDALEIAMKVDPKRERTLGVLTKLDLMDAGTHAREVLENHVLPLQRGYVGVSNRSQKDIEEGKDIDASLKNEKRFFENHPAYSQMADVMGSPYLQKVLHVQLREHIKQTLPAVRKELKQKLNNLRSELREFEALINLNNDNSNAVQAYLFNLVQIFINDIDTKLFGNCETVSMDKLRTGAMINFKVYTDLQKIFTMPTDLTDEKLMTLVANAHGIRNILSIPPLTLEAACGAILKLYRDPLESFVDSITELLISGVEDSANLISAYPDLKAELVRYINDSIDKASIETKDLLAKHIKAEMNFCNIYHWDFDRSKYENGLQFSPVKIWKSFKEENGETAKKKENSEKENSETEDSEAEDSEAKDSEKKDMSTSSDYISEKLRKNVNAQGNAKTLAAIVKKYMQLIQKQIGDITIKYVMCFLVKAVSDFIKSQLMVKLMMSDNLKSLMVECERDFLIRDEIQATCNDLEEALNAVQSF